jgi:hypothetical protein
MPTSTDPMDFSTLAGQVEKGSSRSMMILMMVIVTMIMKMKMNVCK